VSTSAATCPTAAGSCRHTADSYPAWWWWWWRGGGATPYSKKPLAHLYLAAGLYNHQQKYVNLWRSLLRPPCS
jgi:hypothetical protein